MGGCDHHQSKVLCEKSPACAEAYARGVAAIKPKDSDKIDLNLFLGFSRVLEFGRVGWRKTPPDGRSR
jgi:hypothetical protein